MLGADSQSISKNRVVHSRQIMDPQVGRDHAIAKSLNGRSRKLDMSCAHNRIHLRAQEHRTCNGFRADRWSWKTSSFYSSEIVGCVPRVRTYLQAQHCLLCLTQGVPLVKNGIQALGVVVLPVLRVS